MYLFGYILYIQQLIWKKGRPIYVKFCNGQINFEQILRLGEKELLKWKKIKHASLFSCSKIR